MPTSYFTCTNVMVMHCIFLITQELKTCVQRKYKHFLWLYDQMAEKFPCISLPPLPIKHAVVATGKSVGTKKKRKKKKGEKKNTSDGTRTRNPRLRRPMPYPLGYGGSLKLVRLFTI